VSSSKISRVSTVGTSTKAVAQASPDGYTLLLSGTNPNAVALPLYRHLNFKPVKDFAAVALIGFGIPMH
jgi:tripartite-type tricarboxylate transporter receptor subunit TctC